MRENTKPGDSVVAQTFRSVSPQEDRTRMCGRFKTWCVRDGETIWVEEGKNVITNLADDYILDVALHNGGVLPNWYIGLTDGTPTVAETDTMVSHAGWIEISTQYDEGTRPAWTPGAISGGSVDNSAVPAAFTFNATITVGGCFLVSDNQKGLTAGTLYSVIAFSADKNLQSTDILNVTYTFTADNQP